jgi:hypothetical protein
METAGKSQQTFLLTPDQKVDIAVRELEALKTEIQKTEKRGEKTLERFKVRGSTGPCIAFFNMLIVRLHRPCLKRRKLESQR